MSDGRPEGFDIQTYRPYIEAALHYSGGTHTFDDVCDAVAAGTMQLWPGVASAIVTEILTTPRKRCLNVFLAGGNLAELEVMTPGVLAWGRERGCTSAVFTGRKGWERTFLTRDGWAQQLAVFEKDL